MNAAKLVHATCVALDGMTGARGVLLRGPSGSGKSDLALRLIDRGARLVSDDQVHLSVEDGALIARAPDTIAGRMEVRGVGIIPMEAAVQARLIAVFDLLTGDGVPRLPEQRSETLPGGVTLPVWRIDPFESSAPLKVTLLADAAICAQPVSKR